MKTPTILVAVDIEGVAGVWRPEQTQAGNGDYERARRWMTQEADAAVRGAFAGGAGTVLVNDSHGHFGNLLADEIDPRAQLIQGKPRQLGMMAGVDQNVDGVLMIGWHSRAKSRGVLAHTTSSFAFARVWLGGLELGEIGLYAALAGEFGVPVLMASGCDVMAAEVAALLPGVACTVVKWSEGARSGRSLSPAQSRAAIEAASRDAVQGVAAAPRAPWRLPTSPMLRVQCQTPALADAFALWPTVQREDAETISVACGTVHEAVRSLNALSVMANALR
ncbi:MULTISPECIES: M55 family metallopeptidase [unclassified Rhizobacter]|uniref:M55 family metallopeptidase n=1 Tax=unclassified Rhizobacter TaxID=2640088 RepID=UPI0006F42CB7|nr:MULTISPECIES: M55 family metallopeptidase [unclassified Rhizobacter]KQU80869.1 aminopeptidase [Rhizobacter sp. Root29]KQW04412.1 aminopeptidase [Rhizobacter sp. Root1238]KRB14457.1 aminopeptidase [Rhizobacter sp. Root16D2]